MEISPGSDESKRPEATVLYQVVQESLALGGVLALWFPAWLSTERFRPLYPLAAIRTLIQAALLLGFGLGALSAALRRRKVLGLAGMGLAVLAALLGGGGATARAAPRGAPLSLGLDWFLLNLLLLALLFVPLERLFPRRRKQGTGTARLVAGPSAGDGSPGGRVLLADENVDVLHHVRRQPPSARGTTRASGGAATRVPAP